MRLRLMLLGILVSLFTANAYARTLYVQCASMAMLRHSEESAHWQLILYDVNAQMTRFTGKDFRQGHIVSAQKFINNQLGQNDKRSIQLNVTLVGNWLSKRQSHQVKSFDLILAKPEYVGRRGEMIYPIKSMSGQPPSESTSIHLKNPTLLIRHVSTNRKS